MTLASTKSNLEELLVEEENRVIALAGRWSTGKSLVGSDPKGLDRLGRQKLVYVSLLGVAGMPTLKLKVV